MALNRSLRNIYFHAAANPDVTLGGLFQNGSITEANFPDMLRVKLIIEANPPRVQEGAAEFLIRQPLSKSITSLGYLGRFLIIPRADSFCEEYRFCHRARNHDRRYIISGLINPEAHIQSNSWVDIGDTLETPKIDSCRNGFLLGSGIHKGFDQHLISMNPDDNYKIVVFDIDIFRLDSRILDPVCRNLGDPNRVSDQLLRWHFHRSILADLRGAGEPILEHDFPPGHEMAGEILAGP
ncbi:hypothetical protein HOY82DRAFT_643520 [Tuber indicum]|nr:hypothetical protein HOY82DRAFT_643520 [Tuber indicum]